MTDEDFEKATRATPEALSKKREISSESDSEADPSKSRRQQLKKKKTTSMGAGAEAFGSLTSEHMKVYYPIGHADDSVANDSELEPFTRPTRLVVGRGDGTLNNSEPRAQDAKIIEQTRRIAELEGKLAATEQQLAEEKREKERAEHRWQSQHGQLQAAERDARELRRANPGTAHYMRAINGMVRKTKTKEDELKRAKEKIIELERELERT